MKTLLFLLLLSFGCSTVQKTRSVTIMSKAPIITEEADFVTKHGVRVWVYDIPVTRDQFELATDIFILGMQLKGIDYSVTVKAIEKTAVEWTNERIMISGVPGGASGVKIGQQITVQWKGKISNSSLYHEWLHAVLFLLVRTPDPEHTSLWWEDLIPELKNLAADSGL